jgi:WD40 repeat protein
MSATGVTVWDVETDSHVRQLTGGGHLMAAQAASAGGKRVAAGDWGRLVWVWDADTGEPVAVGRGHTERIFRVAIAPDGSRVAAIGRDSSASALRVWDLDGQRPVRTFAPTMPGEVPLDAGLAWHPDGQKIAAAMGGGQTGVYDLSGKTTAVRNGYQFAWNRTGHRAVAQRADKVFLFNAEQDDPVHTLDLPGQIKSFAWNPIDDRLAIRVGLNLWLYDPSESEPLIQLHDDLSLQGRSGYHPCGGVAWHPDGRQLAFASQNGGAWSIRLIDPATRTTESKFPAMPLTVWAVKWSPDARQIAVAGDDPAIKVFDPATGQLVHSLRGHTFTVRDLAYSPDGSRLASTGLDGNVLLWETKSGRLILSFEMGSPALAVAWSPDGTNLAALTQTGAVKVWEAGNYRMAARARPLSGLAGANSDL